MTMELRHREERTGRASQMTGPATKQSARRHCGAMRSIELRCAIAHPRISRFRVGANARPGMTVGEYGLSPAGTRNYAENKFAAAKNSFIIFVDRIFTTLIVPLFTNVFDAIAPIAAFS